MLGLNLKKLVAVLFLGGALAQFQPVPPSPGLPPGQLPPSSPGFPQGQPFPGGQVYQNPNLGMAFPIPPGFQLVGEQPAMGGLVALFLGPGGAELYAVSQPANGDLQTFHQANLQRLNALDAQLRMQGIQVQRQPLQGLSLGGRPALGVQSLIVFQGMQYVDLAVYTVEGGRAYGLQLTAPAQVLPQVQGAFQALIGQVQILGQAPGFGPTPPGFGPTPPGFAPPQPGFGPTPPGFGPTPPGFPPTPPGFEPTPPGFGPTPPGFGPTPPGQGPGFGPTPPGFEPTPPGFGPTPPGFASPPGGTGPGAPPVAAPPQGPGRGSPPFTPPANRVVQLRYGREVGDGQRFAVVVGGLEYRVEPAGPGRWKVTETIVSADGKKTNAFLLDALGLEDGEDNLVPPIWHTGREEIAEETFRKEVKGGLFVYTYEDEELRIEIGYGQNGWMAYYIYCDRQKKQNPCTRYTLQEVR